MNSLDKRFAPVLNTRESVHEYQCDTCRHIKRNVDMHDVGGPLIKELDCILCKVRTIHKRI